MTFKILYSLAAVALLGCAGRTPDPTVTANTRRTSVLSAEEIARAHADVNTAYDAVARLRPNWLTPKGVTSNQYDTGTEYATVYVDGQRYGDLNSLRGIQAFHVGSIRYYDVTQAGSRFGIRGGASGVIEVSMKTGPR
jgi:hypothetical protein